MRLRKDQDETHTTHRPYQNETETRQRLDQNKTKTLWNLKILRLSWWQRLWPRLFVTSETLQDFWDLTILLRPFKTFETFQDFWDLLRLLRLKRLSTKLFRVLVEVKKESEKVYCWKSLDRPWLSRLPCLLKTETIEKRK